MKYRQNNKEVKINFTDEDNLNEVSKEAHLGGLIETSQREISHSFPIASVGPEHSAHLDEEDDHSKRCMFQDHGDFDLNVDLNPKSGKSKINQKIATLVERKFSKKIK